MIQEGSEHSLCTSDVSTLGRQYTHHSACPVCRRALTMELEDPRTFRGSTPQVLAKKSETHLS